MSLEALILCALERAGEPQTNLDLWAAVQQLAADGFWPPEAYTRWKVKHVQGATGNMVGKTLARAGTRREDGRDVPLYKPLGRLERWDRSLAPIPDPPKSRSADPTQLYSASQIATMLDGFGNVVAAAVRLDRTLEAAEKNLAATQDSIRAARLNFSQELHTAAERLRSVGIYGDAEAA